MNQTDNKDRLNTMKIKPILSDSYMKNLKKYLMTILGTTLLVSNISIAQSNSCKGEVSRANSLLRRAISTQNRLDSQVQRDENQVVIFEGQKELMLAGLRATEEAAKADRTFSSLSCVVTVAMGLTFETRQVQPKIIIEEGSNIIKCSQLIARLEIMVQKASARRRAREKSFNARIAVIQKRLDRNIAKLATATSETVRLQASYDQKSAACEVATAKVKCVTDEVKVCSGEKKQCLPARNQCNTDNVTTCKNTFNTGSNDYKNCITTGSNQCKDTYVACYNVDCLARAKTRCGA
jgi:hypothetical protein